MQDIYIKIVYSSPYHFFKCWTVENGTHLFYLIHIIQIVLIKTVTGFEYYELKKILLLK